MKALTVQELVKRSGHSKIYLFLMNCILPWVVPFNAPHHLKITSAKPGEVKVILPYRRSNRNHVKSLHACALATLCEYTTGITLLSMISEKEYRILLKALRIEYFYQGTKDAVASFSFRRDALESVVIKPLTTAPSIVHEFEIKVFDTGNNHLCTGYITWQVKSWSK